MWSWFETVLRASSPRGINYFRVFGSIGVMPRRPKNILEHFRAGKQPRLAARRRDHLQADRQTDAVNPHGSDRAGQHTSVIA